MESLSLGGTLSVSGGSQTLVPTHDVHHLSGSGSIVALTPPSPDFCGRIILINDGGGSIDTSGATDITPHSTLGLINTFVHDPNTGKWYWS